MTQIATRLISGSTLTGSAATYYTAGTATTVVIKKLIICNTTAGALSVTIYLVPSGGSAGVTNTITSARAIAAGETWCCPEAENQVLPTGGFISAFGSGLTIIASGIAIT